MDRSFALAVGERDARRIVLLCIAAAVLAGYIGYAVNQHFAKPQTFDDWFPKHQKHCRQCSDFSNSVLCDEAFSRLSKHFADEAANH